MASVREQNGDETRSVRRLALLKEHMADHGAAEPVSTILSSTTPTTVAEENIRAVARLRARAQQRRTLAQRLGDWITVCAARESRVAFHLVWFALWIAANSGHGFITPFDPFPFALLTTIVSLEAIFLTLFVLASENRLTQQADRRGQLDLQVNLLAEQEMTMVLRMLKEVCEHLELRETITSQKFLELVKRTDVSQLAAQLEHCEPVEPTGEAALGSGGPVDAERRLPRRS
jgi:uncharacterized membrane protein